MSSNRGLTTPGLAPCALPSPSAGSAQLPSRHKPSDRQQPPSQPGSRAGAGPPQGPHGRALPARRAHTRHPCAPGRSWGHGQSGRRPCAQSLRRGRTGRAGGALAVPPRLRPALTLQSLSGAMIPHNGSAAVVRLLHASRPAGGGAGAGAGAGAAAGGAAGGGCAEGECPSARWQRLSPDPPCHREGPRCCRRLCFV